MPAYACCLLPAACCLLPAHACLLPAHAYACCLPMPAACLCCAVLPMLSCTVLLNSSLEAEYQGLYIL